MRKDCEHYGKCAYSLECDGKGEIGEGDYKRGICTTYLSDMKKKNLEEELK